MAVSLAKSLEACGCKMDASDFRDLAMEMHAVLFSSWTIDELVCHPDQALELCWRVCSRVEANLPADLILRTLMNCRRTGGAA